MREMLPITRPALTLDMKWPPGEQRDGLHFSATFGFNAAGIVREAFCQPFKSGAQLQDHVKADCIILSLALQHGATMADIAKALGEDDPEPPRAGALGG